MGDKKKVKMMLQTCQLTPSVMVENTQFLNKNYFQ